MVISPDTTEYKDHVTVLGCMGKKFKASIMTWDKHDERYVPSWQGPAMSEAAAQRLAVEKAARLGLEIR